MTRWDRFAAGCSEFLRGMLRNTPDLRPAPTCVQVMDAGEMPVWCGRKAALGFNLCGEHLGLSRICTHLDSDRANGRVTRCSALRAPGAEVCAHHLPKYAGPGQCTHHPDGTRFTICPNPEVAPFGFCVLHGSWDDVVAVARWGQGPEADHVRTILERRAYAQEAAALVGPHDWELLAWTRLVADTDPRAMTPLDRELVDSGDQGAASAGLLALLGLALAMAVATYVAGVAEAASRVAGILGFALGVVVLGGALVGLWTEHVGHVRRMAEYDAGTDRLQPLTEAQLEEKLATEWEITQRRVAGIWVTESWVDVDGQMRLVSGIQSAGRGAGHRRMVALVRDEIERDGGEFARAEAVIP